MKAAGKAMKSRLADAGALAAPLPSHVEPMLAVPSEMPADESRFGFEYKWDGIRALYFFNGSTWKLETRNLLEVTGSYPELDGLAAGLGVASVVLDGEVVTLDDDGRPSFGRLQHRLGLTEKRARARASQTPVTYMIFDVLYVEGLSVTGMAYEARREVLEGLGLEGRAWRTPPSYVGSGGPVLEAARENGLEGVMAKRLGSAYQAGLRSRDWRKVKLVRRQEFVVGGWTPLRTGAGAVGALMVGYYESTPRRKGRAAGRLVYAGKVGTGFSDRDRQALARALEARPRDTSPFAEPVSEKGALFTEPELVAEVEYRGWTNAGRLRQPSFKGLRTDKSPTDVVREEAVL